MPNHWRSKIDKTVKPHIEAQIKAASYHKVAYNKAQDPSNAQLWVAIGNLSKQLLDMHHKVGYLEKALQESFLNQAAKAKKPAVKKAVAKKTAVKAPTKTEVKNIKGMFANVLVQPRITEKATVKAETGVYVFEVATNATKKEIGSAVKHYYNVTPVKVNIVKIPSKKVSSRTTRKKGVKAGGKKAYVFLKKGDKIEIV